MIPVYIQKAIKEHGLLDNEIEPLSTMTWVSDSAANYRTFYSYMASIQNQKMTDVLVIISEINKRSSGESSQYMKTIKVLTWFLAISASAQAIVAILLLIF